MTSRDSAAVAIVLSAVVVTTIVYWPALNGPFMFDDLRNLGDMAEAGGVTDWPSFALWAFGGAAGPLGRPIALISFLLNDFTWPSDPWSFKYTNLLLHLATGLLLFWLLRELALRFAPQESRERAAIAAACAASLWLIHPIQMATAMFVVQRMTILCTAFMIAGAITWLKGAAIAQRRPIAGSALMLGGLCGFGALAVLSKETGVLLPCYLAVIAFTLSPLHGMSRRLRLMHWLVLLAPPTIAVAYFAIDYPVFAKAFVIRDFSPAQRVMTEPMILWGYLRELIAPDLRIGLYFDDLTAARSLFDPPSAALGLLAWMAIVTLAIWLRKREPVASFAVLWFVVGHALEAGPLALELAFLHRNYLPCAGPIFAAAYYLLALEPRRLRWFLAASLGAAYGLITALNAATWGDEGLLVNTWAAQRPGSQRAQQAAASFWLRHHDLPQTLAYLERAVAADPASPALRIQRLYLRCINEQPQVETWSDLLAMLPKADVDTSTAESLELLSQEIAKGRCTDLRTADVRDAAERLMSNPRYASARWQRSLEIVIGNTYVIDRDLNAAMSHLDLAYAALPAIQIARSQATLLISAGLYADAIAYLEREKDTPPRNFGERIYFDQRIRPAIDQEIESLRLRSRTGSGSS